MSVNKVILIGNVGKDPEFKTLDAGKVVNFSLATSESYKNKAGEKVTNTEWHSVTFWNEKAELVHKWVHKGDTIYVEGKLTTREYEKEGQKHYVTSVKGDVINFISKNNNGSKEAPKDEPKPDGKVSAEGITHPDDLPF